jgi:hypothetical protein
VLLECLEKSIVEMRFFVSVVIFVVVVVFG